MNYATWICGLVDIVHTRGTCLLLEVQQENVSWDSLKDSIYMILGILSVLAGLSLILLVGGVCVSKTRLFRCIVLSTVQDTRQGYTARTYSDNLIGLQGTAQTPLRPAGKAMIGGVCYDVKTLGTYVESGAAVVVIDLAGTSLTVQAIHQG